MKLLLKKIGHNKEGQFFHRGLKTLKILALAILLLILGEVILQVRSHLRYGQSVLNAVKGETTYIYNSELGLKTLRPGAIIQGKMAVIEANSLGLRMPELPAEKPDDEFWIALLGASTVMGTYTRSNDSILSTQLESFLQPHSNSQKVRVINAGIAGYGLESQRKMLSYLLSKYEIDAVVAYTGFNDISGYCKQPASKAMTNNVKNDYSLMDIQAPKWLLTVKLITMNTVKLRDVPAGKLKMINPKTIDTSSYKKSVRDFLKLISREVPKALIVLNARSFRQEMPYPKQSKLSQTARYYLPCFSIQGLHEVYDRHNMILKNISKENHLQTLSLMKHLPGGEKYFADSTHFTDEGTKLSALIISEKIKNWIIKE